MRIVGSAAAALLLAGCQSGTGGNQAAPAPGNAVEAANTAVTEPAPANIAEPANTAAPVKAVTEIDLRNVSAAEVATRLASLSGQPTMTPGLWETRVSRELVGVRGLPQAQKDALMARVRADSARTSRDCVTDRKTLLPQMRDLQPFGSECRFARYHVTAGRFEVKANCTSPAHSPVSVGMSGNYSATSVALGLDLNLTLPSPPGATMHTRARSRTRRVGECPAAAGGAAPKSWSRRR